MAETIYDERMGDSDALTWTIERDPLLRSTIVSVWLLDCLPDLDRAMAKFEHTVRVIPRLRQRVVEDPLGVAPPRWAPDPYFDLAYHVRRAGAPGKGGTQDEPPAASSRRSSAVGVGIHHDDGPFPPRRDRPDGGVARPP